MMQDSVLTHGYEII